MRPLVDDLRRALVPVWLILSAVLFAAAVAPWVVPEQTLVNLFPPCEARLRGRPCIACGMTTAYVAISRGEFAVARGHNAGAVPLYFGSLANFFAAAAYVTVRAWKRQGRTDECRCLL